MLLSVSCMSTCNVLAFLLRRLKQDKSSLLGNNLVLVSLEFDLSNTMLSLCNGFPTVRAPKIGGLDKYVLILSKAL